MHIEVLRGVSQGLKQENFIQTEIQKILREEGITLKKDLNHTVNKDGSPDRSTRHRNALPYHPVGFIVETTIENIKSINNNRDSLSGYGNKKGYAPMPTNEVKAKLNECEVKECFSFGGEIILGKIKAENINAVYIDRNENRCTRSDDGNRTSKYNILPRLIEAVAMQQEWKHYTGKTLNITDVETEKILKSEDLIEEIELGIKTLDQNSSIGVKDFDGILDMLTLLPDLFIKIKNETQGFIHLKKDIKQFCLHAYDDNQTPEELWEKFVGGLDKEVAKHETTLDLAKSRGFIKTNNLLNIENLNAKKEGLSSPNILTKEDMSPSAKSNIESKRGLK